MKRPNKRSKKMRKAWNQRARENVYAWVDSSKKQWNKDEYYNKGIKEVFNHAVSFFRKKKFSGKDLKKMKVLDLGCGTGRLTAGLAKYFGSVDGIDVSEEMIKIAKRDNKRVSNIRFFLNNGYDLSGFPNNHYDFVFSFLVFQHIPRRSIIVNYLKELYRVLTPGGHIKIQVRGYPGNVPVNLAEWRYRGFDSFYVVLSKKWKIPLLRLFRYDNVFGAFFKRKLLEKKLKEIGYVSIELFHEPDNKGYLWASAKKP